MAGLAWVTGCGDGATGPPPPPPDPPRPTTVTVAPATAQVNALGATVQFAAQVLDQNGQATAGATVTWLSSATDVATVNSAGLAVAVANGTATITAAAGGVSGTATMTVAQEVRTVAVSPGAATLVVGDTLRLAAGATDANGHMVQGVGFTWASDDATVAVVDATGLVTGVGAGAVEITAAAEGVTGPSVLTVFAPAPTTVAVTPDIVAFAALRQTAQLAAEVRDQNGRVVEGVSVSWSSADTTVAAVDSAGLVTAIGGGATTIAATAGAVSGTAVVTVMQSAGSVVVSPAADTVATGDTLRLAAEAFDENGHRVGGAEFGWSSSDVSVATVDASGLVTGVAEGTVTVTAATGDASGASEITVENPDRATLVALYNATDGPNWVNSENWLTDSPLGDWYGVDTDGSGRVVRLHLAGIRDPRSEAYEPHGLTGSLPSELGNLTALMQLHLGYNTLNGQIPSELGNLANLTQLNFEFNTLTGPIPPELGNLSNLTILALGLNNLTGPIPPELGNLESLTAAGLARNELTGPIPPELGNLSNLRSLSLRSNSLTGQIPPELGRLESLTAAGLTRNELTGPIPPELGNLSNLRSLSLRSNSLTGQIPPELGRLERLTTLLLDGNGLTGHIPPELGGLANLTLIRLSNNKLVGPIPRSLIGLARLRTFYFARNDGLCAPGTTDFVTWLDGIGATDGPYCNEADAAVLEQLYNASGGPNWTNSDGWLDPPVLADWHGVSADSLGRVTELDLTGNGLAGSLSATLGNLARMASLRIGSNVLSGPLPSNLTQLPLHEFHYADTELCVPPLSSFRTWLNGIASHRGTGVECAPPSEREILKVLYDGTDGPNWTRSDNWLTDMPLGDWYGVGADASGRVDMLRLIANNLTGTIPAELGQLSRLTELVLWNNSLSGRIPPELGELRSLSLLVLGANELTGPIPAELGQLSRLTEMWLRYNNLSGPLPPQLGNLAGLQILSLDDNAVSGPIPPAFGRLTALERLELDYNRLTGPVPPEIGGMSSLKRLSLTNNGGMSGPLPSELTRLGLEALIAGGTDLCAPRDPTFQAWLETVYHRRIVACGNSGQAMAYLTQAVQSEEHPVPLVADEKALLRVFVTASRATTVGIPPVRARFYANGTEIHVADIAASTSPISTEVVEGDLSSSANVEIPGEVVQPGLEMVIEVDPDGTLDSGLGVAKRIPATGRLAVDVQAMPPFDLTLIPFVWTQTGDSSVADLIDAMEADPENHELLEEARTLLPISALEVTAHEPVLNSNNRMGSILRETRAIRAMEGGRGHYMGMMSYPVQGGLGFGDRPGRVSFAVPASWVIGHELGHNLSLRHAPCGVSGTDPSFPTTDGSTGVWGYDFRNGGSLVAPSAPDLMSYCPPQWISDYHFSNALRFRLFDEDPPAAAPTRSLLLWGGLDADGVPLLEPAFVVEAPAALPDSAGAHRLIGHSGSGAELFSLSFTMPETADGDGSSSFAFVLPVRPGWEAGLGSITLSGPGGSVTLDAESDRPMAILHNPRTGQVRGILRDLPPPTQVGIDAAGGAAGPGLEVMFSRGVPDEAAWRR